MQTRQAVVPRDIPQAVIELMRAADYARRQMVAALEPFDVTLQQTNVLIILRRAAGEGVPTLEVANQLIEQAPGITRLMNALAVKKYIRRRRCRDDRRQQLCFLTEKGSRLLDSLLPALDGSCARIMRTLPEDRIPALIGLLTAVSAGDR